MILHVHKDKTDEMNLQSVAREFCFREYRQNISGQFKYILPKISCTSEFKSNHG